jgi:hypothetical protein
MSFGNSGLLDERWDNVSQMLVGGGGKGFSNTFKFNHTGRPAIAFLPGRLCWLKKALRSAKGKRERDELETKNGVSHKSAYIILAVFRLLTVRDELDTRWGGGGERS